MRKLLFAALSLAFATDAIAQGRIVDLHMAMAQGDIAIESVFGTGGSTGAVLDARLANRSSRDVLIDVFLRAPLYLRNSGGGQNMVATQLYGRDGSYFVDGDNRGFVRLGASERLPVTLVAYCADFDLDNPTAAEAFSVATVPEGIEGVMKALIEQQRQDPSTDYGVAGQLALWVAQGHSLDEIRARFPFTPFDVAQMERLLAMTPGSQL